MALQPGFEQLGQIWGMGAPSPGQTAPTGGTSAGFQSQLAPFWNLGGGGTALQQGLTGGTTQGGLLSVLNRAANAPVGGQMPAGGITPTQAQQALQQLTRPAQPSGQPQSSTSSGDMQSLGILSLLRKGVSGANQLGSVLGGANGNAFSNIGGVQGLNLGALMGPLGLASGAISGNPMGITGGALGTLGAINNFAGPALGASSGLTQGIGGALGGLGGLLGIYGGVDSLMNGGSPFTSALQIGTGALGAYGGASSLISAFGGPALPGLATALVSVAPSTAAAIATALGVEVAATAAPTAIATALGSAISGVAAGAAAPVAILALIVTNMIASSEEMNARSSGWWNNPIKGQLSSNATAGVGNANNIMGQINQVGLENIPTDALMQVLSPMSNSLMPYYATAQGGRGAIRASDTFTGGSGMTQDKGSEGLGGVEQYTQNFTNAQGGLVNVIQELMNRGVSYEQLGQLPVSGNWVQQSLDMYDPLQDFYNLNAGKWDAEAGGILGRSSAGYQRTGLNNENYLVPYGDGQYTVMQPSNLTPANLFQSAQGAAALGPDAITKASGHITSMYGGPLWAMLARMGAGGSEIQSLIQQHFDPWVNMRNSNQVPTTMQPLAQQQNMEEAARYQDFTSGGGGF